MIVKSRRHLLPVCEIWFSCPEKFNASNYALCSFFLNNPYIPKNNEYVLSKREAMTLETDLELSDVDLLAKCESNVRNEIRRAKKDGVKCQMFMSPELLGKPAVVKHFCDCYDEMHEKKGMPKVSVLNHLNSLIIAGVLQISVACINNVIVAYHVYLVGDRIARLLYSVSEFRSFNSSAERNAIGRANRLLHYEDMLWLKNNGYYLYDWGGFATDSRLDSINSFKKGFGGEIRSRFHFVITTHRVIQLIYKVKHRFQ